MTRYIVQQKTFNIDISKWRDQSSPVTKEEKEAFLDANPC